MLFPSGIAVSPVDNSIYASTAGEFHGIWKWNLTNKQFERFVGFYDPELGQSSGYADGQGSAVKFNNPSSIVCTSTGNIIVLDTDNNCLREIDTVGNTLILAGTAGITGGWADGLGEQAQFNHPTGMCIVGSGVNEIIYVADTNNHVIRKITSDRTVTTIAGSPGSPGNMDFAISYALGGNGTLNYPSAIVATIDQTGRTDIWTIDKSGYLRMVSWISGRWEVWSVKTLSDTGDTVNITSTGGISVRQWSAYTNVPTTGSTLLISEGFTSNKVQLLTFTGGTGILNITPVAKIGIIAGRGTADSLGSRVDGQGIFARFNTPLNMVRGNPDLTILANAYVADYGNDFVRAIDTNSNPNVTSMPFAKLVKPSHVVVTPATAPAPAATPKDITRVETTPPPVIPPPIVVPPPSLPVVVIGKSLSLLDTIAGMDLDPFRRSLFTYKWSQSHSVRTSRVIDPLNTYSQAGSQKTIMVLGTWTGETLVPYIPSSLYTDAATYFCEKILNLGTVTSGSDIETFRNLLASYLQFWTGSGYEEETAVDLALQEQELYTMPDQTTDRATAVTTLIGIFKFQELT